MEIVIYGLMVIGSSLLNYAPSLSWQGLVTAEMLDSSWGEFYIGTLQAGRSQERAIRSRIDSLLSRSNLNLLTFLAPGRAVKH